MSSSRDEIFFSTPSSPVEHSCSVVADKLPALAHDVVVPRVRIVFRGGASTNRSNNANGPAQRISELNHNRTKQLMQESIQHYQRNTVQSGRLQQAVPRQRCRLLL